MIRLCSVACIIVEGLFTRSQRGPPRERNHISVNDPAVDPQSSLAQTLIDPRRVSDTILSGQPRFAGSRQGPPLSSMTSAEAAFDRKMFYIVGSWFQETSSERMQTCRTEQWTRTGENQGLKTRPSVAGWQARRCWWKCSRWNGRRIVLETFWRLCGRGKIFIARYDRLNSEKLGSIFKVAILL